MPELTDDDFRRRPDPAKQLRLAAAGKLAAKRERGPGTVRHDAEHGKILCGPVAKIIEPTEVKPKKRRGMNKTEAEYADGLKKLLDEGGIKWFAFEPIRVRLAEGAWYKPDFLVVLNDGRLECMEVKGFWREAARVRIKVAAELHKWARFVAVTKRKKKDGGGWREEEF